MARVFPELTEADIAAMLDAIQSMPPITYTDNDRELVGFEFETLHIGVYIVLKNREFDLAARRELEEAVGLLPRFRARLARSLVSAPDDLDLQSMEVNGDEIYLGCCCREFNAQPDYWFSKACHGGPIHLDRFHPEWRTSTAVALSRQIHDSQDFSTMPILADALQDAGCISTDILEHCRSSHTHHRGCRVVELVLGMQ
ncbi:MAG: hypothetical protein U0792_07605 [Gemmataceae bacterium]